MLFSQKGDESKEEKKGIKVMNACSNEIKEFQKS
jgi:hypothetical protein